MVRGGGMGAEDGLGLLGVGVEEEVEGGDVDGFEGSEGGVSVVVVGLLLLLLLLLLVMGESWREGSCELERGLC